jgi:acylglycerol lipase
MSKTLLWRPSIGFGGHKAALHWWRNAQGFDVPTRGTIWIVHGMGEHAARYDEFANHMTQLGLDVCAPDLPGCGLTKFEGGQSVLPTLDEIINELCAAYRFFVTEAQPNGKKYLASPWYLMGHSLGAISVLAWIVKGQRPIEGQDFAARAFVSGPPFGLRMPVPGWKLAAVKTLNALSPNLKLNNEIKTEYLAYDAGTLGAARKDPLMHFDVSPKQYLSLQSWIQTIQRQVADIEIPVAVACGRDDPIVDPASVEAFYRSLKTHKTLFMVENSKHEILFDLSRREVFRMVAEWFL